MNGLNGDAKIIFDKIDELEKDTEKRHDDNQRLIRTLFKKFGEVNDGLLTLPCGVHKERFKMYDAHMKEGGRWRLAVFSIAVGLLVTVGGGLVAWGSLKEKVSNHIEFAEKVLEPHVLIKRKIGNE